MARVRQAAPRSADALGGWPLRVDHKRGLLATMAVVMVLLAPSLISFGRENAVAWENAPTLSPAHIGAARVEEMVRSDHAMAGRTRTALPGAENFVSFAIEQPVQDIRVVRVAGELDLLTTPLLKIRLQQGIEGGPGHLVVDLRGVTFLAVSGLKCLTTARKAAARRGVQLHLTGTDHRVVARPLEITGLRASFDIHPTVDSVVAILDGHERLERRA